MLVSYQQKVTEDSKQVIQRMLTATVSEADELEFLKSALRESRKRLHRSALESTKKVMALSCEIASLEAANRSFQLRIQSLEPVAAESDRDGALARLREENQLLRGEARRAWALEKTLVAAHGEYARLAEERDDLALACAELRARLSD